MRVIVVEDGHEYTETLSRFLKEGFEWIRAGSGPEALVMLDEGTFDAAFLDMRFDRIPRGDLLGDHAAATREHNGDPLRGWRYLENNQGLFVLNALHAAGYGGLPVILAYDFSREAARLKHLQARYPRLSWVPDAVTPEAIRERMLEVTQS